MQGHDEFYRNVEGRTFARVSREIFPKTPWGSMGAQVLDWNRDGRLDLFVTDMHSDMSEKIGLDKELLKADWIEKNWSKNFLQSGGRSVYGNALYKQSKGQRFNEVADEMNVENYSPSITCFDFIKHSNRI